MGETRRELHVDFLNLFSIKKGILHIHLKKWPTWGSRNYDKCTNIGKASHRGKCLLIVNAILLSESLGNETSLVAINSTI